MMVENMPPTNGDYRFSSRTVLVAAVLIGIGLIPMAVFGWKGILSSTALAVAAIVFVVGKRGIALGIILALTIGQFLYPVFHGADDAIRRTSCKNNIRKLTIAFLKKEKRKKKRTGIFWRLR